MSTKWLIVIAVVLLIAALASYFLLFREDTKDPSAVVEGGKGSSGTQVSPPNTVVVPVNGNGTGMSSGPPPGSFPTQKQIIKGGAVYASEDIGMYNGSGLVTRYTEGGTNDNGKIQKDQYAGTVLEINAVYKSVKVSNHTDPAKVDNPGWGTGSTVVYEFWVPLNKVYAK